MRGRRWCWMVLAGLLVVRHAGAQTSPPAGVTLIAPGNGDALSAALAKAVAVELQRRKVPMVSDAEGSAALARPLSAAIADCSGDDLCYSALGQVVRATTVVVVTAAVSSADAKSQDCDFHSIDVKSGKVLPRMRFTVAQGEQGTTTAAYTVVEKTWPRPRAVATATAPPPIPAPTIAPAPTPAPATVASASPTPTAFAAVSMAAPDPTPVDGLDQPPPRPRKPRRPVSRDRAFWGLAGAGALALGLGLFLGTRASSEEPEKKEGTSTVEVRF